MIVVTGAAGFIGSCMIRKLNDENFNHIIAVDHFDRKDKMKNLEGKKILEFVDRDNFFNWLDENYFEIEFIFHLGARTDTTESDYLIFKTLNLEYSKEIWRKCCNYQIPLIYASSAATYGNGNFGYDDDFDQLDQLKPLNPYGQSKQEFDIWATQQEVKPLFWCGLKFFNVFGPNEYHKSRMASVVFHAYNQIRQTGKMKLFRSHHPDYKDGEQKRDFIYVKDVIEVMYWLMHHREDSGIYNLGSGIANTFNELVNSLFRALALPLEIEYVDTPEDIRDNYQYFTKANMKKLRSRGYSNEFQNLDNSISDYVENFLGTGSYY